MARQADRLDAIIEDLLALSALEQGAGDSQVELRPASVGAVVQSAAAALGPKSERAGVSIEVGCSDSLIASMNTPLLEQAIANLLDNAVKYSPAGGVVTIDCGIDGGEVYISVSDNGPGIEPQHIPRLFERFYRADKARSRKMGGTGLGLAIVNHIVRAHHGRVHVESAPGRGSTFAIRLPALSPDHAPPAAESPQH